MKIQGKVWKYGDDVNTDVIFPGKYTYTIKERSEMAKVALEDLDPEFTKNAVPGDIIVGGKNWGCGSSREQAATVLSYNGVRCIIARSFARIFFRNCVATGELYPCETADRLCDHLKTGDTAKVDLDAGTVTVLPSGKAYSLNPLGDVRPVVDSGGLFNYARKTGMMS